MYTKREIAEMLMRPFNTTDSVRQRMIENISQLPNQKFIQVSINHGLPITRIRDNQFHLGTFN
jgi:hypothetical protein